MIEKVIQAAVDFNRGDAPRIMHLLKVYALARTIGMAEGLSPRRQEILEMAAVLHDIGIHPAEEKYQSSAGFYQEQEGPPIARVFLGGLNVPEEDIDRVCWLIAHHHHYDHIEGIDYQILVEADFLVNMQEEKSSPEAVAGMRSEIFRTRSGKEMLDGIFSSGTRFE